MQRNVPSQAKQEPHTSTALLLPLVTSSSKYMESLSVYFMTSRSLTRTATKSENHATAIALHVMIKALHMIEALHIMIKTSNMTTAPKIIMSTAYNDNRTEYNDESTEYNDNRT